MYGNIFWKLVLTTVIASWAAWNLFPVRETPFPDYVRNAATAHQEEFLQLLDRAEQIAGERQGSTVFIVLRDLANEEKVDLHRFFPHIRLEETLRNIQRRNDLLMNELLRRSRASIPLGLDLRGGVSFTLEFQQAPGAEIGAFERQDMMAKAIEIIRQRADGLGVAEPVIRPVGDNRIEVQLPGVTTRDNPEISETLQRPARLEFRLVHRTLRDFLSEEDLPPGYEVLAQEIEDPRTGDIELVPYVVRRIPSLTGEAIERAAAVTDQFGRYTVSLNFTSEGGSRFADLTREIASGNRSNQPLGQLAIVLDGVLYSAPTVRDEIRGGRAEITGRFSQREAVELANVLNNPLDVPLAIVEMYEVGPSLAEDAVDSARTALIIGACSVVVFMVFYYLAAGVVAAFTLTVNVVIILGVLASIGATLTLPGIAGIILTIGMAVDANIIIFERIREELRMGKTLRTALAGGYEKALSTIVDANVTTLLTASILIILGTGPVKGFGVTLAIGIFTSVFGALIISRFVLEFLINPGHIKQLRMFALIRETNIDFLNYRKIAFGASWILVLVGLVAVWIRDPYGIDFIGGDEVRMAFEQRLTTTQIEEVAAANDIGEVLPVYQAPIGGGREILSIQTRPDFGEKLVSALKAAFPEAGLEVVGENRIGPSVGKEIRNNALLAVAVALIGILLYVALRFEMGYGVGAVVAVVHDVLMTIGIFVLSDRQFTAPMVAGILMVVGYSINDTIVIFDRIREQLTLDTTAKLKDIVNQSINRVLGRSLLTSITTLLATMPLFLFASGAVADFAFIFIIGILTGTFSSIFIASPVFYWWHKGDRRHVEERKDVLPNYDWVASSKASK